MSATIDIREEVDTADYLSRADVELPHYPKQAYSLIDHYVRPDYVGLIAAERDPGPVDRQWLRPTTVRLTELMTLRPGWDGGSAKAVELDTVVTTLMVLSRVASATSPAPWIVPLASGGVQLEWHEPDLTIEIALDPEHGHEIYVSAEDEEHEGDLTGATLTLVRQFVGRLAR